MTKTDTKQQPSRVSGDGLRDFLNAVHRGEARLSPLAAYRHALRHAVKLACVHCANAAPLHAGKYHIIDRFSELCPAYDIHLELDEMESGNEND